MMLQECLFLVLRRNRFATERPFCSDFIFVLNIELIFRPEGDSAVINLISAINSSAAVDYYHHGAQRLLSLLLKAI